VDGRVPRISVRAGQDGKGSDELEAADQQLSLEEREFSGQNQKFALYIPIDGIPFRLPEKVGRKMRSRGCLKRWPTTRRASDGEEAIFPRTSPVTH
jgi:hypothetical protein